MSTAHARGPRGALAGALTLPFLLLPLVITLYPPDIHGGYALHARAGLALALAGAVGGVAMEGARRRRGAALARLLAVATAVVLAGVGLFVALAGYLLGHVLSAALGLATPARFEMPSDPRPVVTALLVAVAAVRAGRVAHDARARLALAGWAALALALVGLVTVAGLNGAPGALWVLPLAAAAAGAGAGPRLVEGRRANVASISFALAGGMVGPVAGRYLAAAGHGGWHLASPWLAALGLPAGALAGAWLERRAARAAEERPARVPLLGALVVAILAPMPVFYVGVLLALSPAAFAAGLVAIVGVAAAARAAGRRGLALLVLGWWVLFYVAVAWVNAFKAGPSAEACRALVARTPARVLLDRFAEDDPAYRETFPYDVLPVPGADAVIATFKRTDVRGGFIEVIDTRDPSRRRRLDVRRADASGPLWPERFVRAPSTGHYYFGMLGAGAFELWEVALDAANPPRPSVVRVVPLAWEPSYPTVDERRGLLVQPYLISRGGVNPLLELFDLATLESRGRVLEQEDDDSMAELVTWDAVRDRYWVPANFSMVRFALVEVDPRTRVPLRRAETFHPTIGLAVDPDADVLYATNPMGGSLVTYGLAEVAPRASVGADAFPRDLELDAERGWLHVGSYAGGTVVGFRVRDDAGAPILPAPAARVEVGSLLRGIGLDRATGTVYAASACGLFEIRPPTTSAEARGRAAKSS